MGTSRVSAPSPPRKRLGVETPRVFTPPLRRLTPRTSRGFSVIDFAETVLEISLYPWQKWLLIHALEILPDGSFRFRTVIVLVARQSGKSTLSQILALWFMFVLGRDLVIGTAQDLDVAEEIWQGAVDLVEETPELDALKDRVVKVNGKKSLELKTGERYKVKAANRRAGRGLSGDLILLDELREHQSWDAWSAVTKTTMAREHAQVWALSNAGDATSVVLRYLRKLAHEALGDPDGINAADDPASSLGAPTDDDEVDIEADDSLGIFEWSAVPGCDIRDRDGWAQANPSLGYGGFTERTVESACATDPVWVFRTEVLCQWSDGSLEGPFPPGAWEACVAPDDQEKPSKVAEGQRIILGLDLSWDRTMAHIAIAGLRDDGLPHVGIITSRVSTEWIVDWLKGGESPPFEAVALQGQGAPVSSLVDELKDAGITVMEINGPEFGKSCGAFYDVVCNGGLRHRPQPMLDIPAATAATKPMSEAWAWDRRKSPTDIAPLVAVTLALHGLSKATAPTDTRVLVFR